VAEHTLARAVLYRGYELQGERLVGSCLERYPDERPAWDAFMEAAQAHHTLETLGISGASGMPEPLRPQELGRQFAYSGAPGGATSYGGTRVMTYLCGGSARDRKGSRGFAPFTLSCSHHSDQGRGVRSYWLDAPQ
jgi:hypothetical protein